MSKYLLCILAMVAKCSMDLLPPVPPAVPSVPNTDALPAVPGQPSIPITQQCRTFGQPCTTDGPACCAPWSCRDASPNGRLCWPAVESPFCVMNGGECKSVNDLCCNGGTCSRTSATDPSFGTCGSTASGK